MVDYKDIRNNIKKIEGLKGLGNFYSGALFRESAWFISREELPQIASVLPVKVSEIKESPTREPEVSSLSKEKVLTSLKENIEKKGAVESKFGSIMKDESASKIMTSTSFEVALSEKKIEENIKSLYPREDFAKLKSVNVLIIGETSLLEVSSEEAHWKSSHDQGDLLGKMIFSMKLNDGEFLRAPLVGKSDSEILENTLKEIIFFKPEVVITLGAVATNILYGKKEKLSKVHGSEFDRQIKLEKSQIDFKLFPIFHPDLLQINPSMKRTAWIDLQKIMKKLGKS
jgi:hypothetical protein